MWPYLFGYKTYSYLYTGSMVAHVVIACWLCRRANVRIRLGALLGLCYAFGMVPGAKLLYDILHQQVHWATYLSIDYYVAGGLWGGPLACLAATVIVVLLYRGDRARLLDIAVLALVVPMIMAKAACLTNGCCYGVESRLPWALVFPEGADCPPGVARHPTQVYEMLVVSAIGVVLTALDRERWKGMLIFWFVALYGVGRPLTELFRGDGPRVPDVGFLTASQAACLLAAIVSFAVLRRRWRTRITNCSVV